MAMGNLKQVLSLEHIPRMVIPPIVRRRHFPLYYVYVIGSIGQWGSSKSLLMSWWAIADFMLYGMKVWSNSQIVANFKISDELAMKCKAYFESKGYETDIEGGGNVVFKSLPLDKKKLLKFDPEFHHGLINLDEINLEFSEARRSTSNTNLFYDRVHQQLRKRKLSMGYTVLDEMWVDLRVRNFTSLYFKCHDFALTATGMLGKKQPGIDFSVTPYEIIPILTGTSYEESRRPLESRTFHGSRVYGINDTLETQAEGGLDYKVTLGEVSKDVEAEYQEWGWLYRELARLADTGTQSVPREKFLAAHSYTKEERNRLAAYITDNRLMETEYKGSKAWYKLLPRITDNNVCGVGDPTINNKGELSGVK